MTISIIPAECAHAAVEDLGICARYTAIMRRRPAVISQLTEAANQIIPVMNTPMAILNPMKDHIRLQTGTDQLHTSPFVRLELVPTRLSPSPPTPSPAISATPTIYLVSSSPTSPGTGDNHQTGQSPGEDSAPLQSVCLSDNAVPVLVCHLSSLA